MIDPNISIVDLNPEHWTNLLKLFAERGGNNCGSLLLFMEGDDCVKAIHTRTGAILGFKWSDDSDAAAVCEQYGAERIGLVPVDLPDRIFVAWQNAVVHADDWDAQIVSILDAVRPFVRGEIEWRPSPPPPLPVLRIDRIERLFKRLWPDETCVALFVCDGTKPFTSIILGKRAGKIALWTSLDALGLAAGPFDWKEEKDRVASPCAECLMPLHAALWIELATFREMIAGPRPLSFMRLAARRGRADLWPAPLKWRIALFLARVFGGQ